MVTSSVKNNVTSNVTNSGKVKWQEALTDAQTGLEKAQKDVSQWKAAVAVIRRKIEVGDLGRENGNQRLRGYAQVNRHRLLSLLATAQEKKEFSYTVGPGAVIYITNNYGPISVKPSGSSQVVVETVSHSDAVSLVNEQHGDRIELRSISSRQGTNLVEYTVLVPAAAFVSLRSSDGTLRAQGLRGDVVLEAASGSVEVTDISDAHLHVKTLNGPISLTDIRNSHLDIHSVRGNVNLHNVTGPSVEVNSGSGRITYDGDPGRAGEYRLTSHTGDLEVSIPASAWVEIKAHSIKSQSDPEFPSASSVPAIGEISLLGKPGKILGARFELRSFSGKIRLKRP